MRSRKLATVALAATLAGCAGLTTLAVASSAAASTPVAAAAPAAADFAGYQVVRLPNANVPNFQRRTVSCPSGKKAIGGGAEARGNEAILIGSFPTDDNNGWIGLGRQPGYNDVGISVFVICANIG